jgi:tryptophan synthase beta chain
VPLVAPIEAGAQASNASLERGRYLVESILGCGNCHTPKTPKGESIASRHLSGGGSNFAGIAFPYIGQALRGGPNPRIVAVEPAACPSLTRGRYPYDLGDTGHMTPLTKMHTLGSSFTPPGLHAGSLRYHGMAPLVSHLKQLGRIEATAYTQNECFSAGVLFARAEGIVPAPEANHAVKGAVEEPLRCKREGRSETILFNLCGHGHFDMAAYQKYF